MAYTRITAAEGAAMINDGDYIALGGFTPNGVPKAVFRELSKRAIREHDAGKPFQVGILTGASSLQSVEGDMANAHAIKFRAPFSTNKDFRTHTNLGEIDYEDMHLGHMAERLRHGFYGTVDWAIIEVSDIEEGDDVCKACLTSAGGIATTIARLAKRVILEFNHFHSPVARLLHDCYEPGECGFARQPIPIIHVNDKVGNDYIEIDPKKIVGVVDCNIPEEARAFKPLTPETTQIGTNVAEFLVAERDAGRIPPQFLPLQSGVGATGNAVLQALGQDPKIPHFEVYSEVVQDAAIDLMEKGIITNASATAMTVTNECLQRVYENIRYFKQHLTIRQSEIANSPEVIRRLGVIALNTPLECDIYGNENSSHICGSKLMNGIGGSCDYERNGYISIFTTPSTAKGGKISSIVPMCCHVDSTEHDVDVIVTEQGVADLRGKGPVRRAHEIIEHCAHPDYRPLLRDYLKHIAPIGHEPQSMRAALAFHDTLLRKGDMRLTDFSEYV
ncbi:MAG: acetyl-CoA hydrolase/transferase C-terminal domain-containing protein [Prevotellaceae bacterium]|nr:acetyl-CoA hydrolase/transferase C-terminal domain-containing protein [Prevotellaceae bacterium]